MNKIKSHFWYNKSQRNGIFFLAILIIILQLVYYFIDFSSNKKINTHFKELIAFQSKIDSLKQIKIEQNKPKIYPFNPSFLTDYKGYKLGMTTTEIDKLLAYRKQGKYINSAKQFQQVTGISDSLLQAIRPYFKFLDWINTKKKNFKYSTDNSFTGNKTDINQASITALQKVNGIGEKLSARIVKFRTSLGGFKNKEQLKKVYGLKPEVYQKILNHFYIKSNNITDKIYENTTNSFSTNDINTATKEDFMLINGIGEKLSTRILKYRKTLGGFYFKDQIEEVYGLNPEVISKIHNHFKIINKPKINKVNINEASFKEILHLPYIDYKLTKKIFEYRDEFAEIQSLSELKKIDSFPMDKYDKIILYLKVE